MDAAAVAAGLRGLSWEKIEDLVLRLVAENAGLAAENAALQRRLRLYENPHTPPNLERRKPRPAVVEPQKRGAPVGHVGATRVAPEPTRRVVVRDETCAACLSKDLESLAVESRRITDLGPVLEPETVQFDVTEHRCKKCGTTWNAKHPDLPRVGNFGVRTLVYASMLRHHMRGPIRRVQDHLLHHVGIELSTKGVYDILGRVEDTCKTEYEKLVAKMRSAPWLHVDETSHKIDGDKVWMWVFRTPTNDVLLVIRPSRGKGVVEEILGENSQQTLIVDGWSAYQNHPRQRCWAHLLRIVDEDKDRSPHAAALSQRVHAIYDELAAFIGQEHSSAERETKYTAIENRVWQTFLDNVEHEGLDDKLTYIQNGRGDWARCVLHPGMPATNNPAEQALREHVIRRRLFQTFRSETGAERYQHAASLLDTWRLQGRDPFQELEALLRRDLCLA